MYFVFSGLVGNLFDFLCKKWLFFGGCFLTFFFEKGGGNLEDVYFWCDPLSEKWRLYITFTNLVNCQTGPRYGVAYLGQRIREREEGEG